MKVILVLCVVILSHQKISFANYLRIDNLGKSSLSTEYQARFHQRHRDGANVSEGNIAGNHHFEKSTNEEPWETFASKCASIIHGLVSALTNAVAPVPGDAMNLELDIKNHIFHHDDRKFNTCKPADALPDCGNVPSTALGPSNNQGGCQTSSYPPDGGILPPQKNYLGTGAVTLCPGIVYDNNAQQLPLSQISGGSPVEYLPIEASPAPEPTMNTPATHEASYETTTPNFSPLPDLQNPVYSMPNGNGFSGLDAQNNVIDGSHSFPSDALPLDNWKPCPNHQTDLISQGTALTDDCNTSPHLAPGLVTPASFPAGNPSPGTYTWDEFYNENPALLSPNSAPSSRPSSALDDSQWYSDFNMNSYPNRQPNHLPPASLTDDSSNSIPSDSLVTPVSSVTDCPPEDICNSQQLAYLAPVEGENGFSNIMPGDNFGTPSASGNDCLPEDTYNNQQPGFVPPFESTNGLPNIMPGDNFGAPVGSGTGGLPEDSYPDPQQGYLPPVTGYNDGVAPSQIFNNPTAVPPNSPLENNYPQQSGYLPPLPPPSFSDVPSDIIPSDNLVTPTAPVTDFPFENNYQNQQPGRPSPQSFNDGLPNNLPGQNIEGSEIDNWGLPPKQQPQQLPSEPCEDDSFNSIPGQNLGGPGESAPLGSGNWGPPPNQQPGQFPPQPFDDDSFNAMPGQNLGGPAESGPFGNGNWGLPPNQQPGKFPPQPFNDDSFNGMPGQNLVPGESAPLGSGNWGSPPNQQPEQLSPEPCDEDSYNDIPDQDLGEPIGSAPLGSGNWGLPPNQQPGQFPPQSFNDDSFNGMPGQNLGESAPLGSGNWGPPPNQQPEQLSPEPCDEDSYNDIPDQDLGEPIGSAPLGSGNWGLPPNQQPGQFPPQSFNDDTFNGMPGQNLGPGESAPLGNGNWGPPPNQQPGKFPPQSFNDDSFNCMPGQNLGGPAESGPFGNVNWGPPPNQQPGQFPPQSFNDDSFNGMPGQNLGPGESAPLGNGNWGPPPKQQPGQLPPQSFNGMPGQNLGGPAESGPFGNGNWGPPPNQQPGQFPPQSFNDDSFNGMPGQNLGPGESAPLGNGNWGPPPKQQPGQLPPQSFNDDSFNGMPGQNLGESAPLGNGNWGPPSNQQPGQLPPQPFNDDSFNDIPDQNLGGPVESDPLASDKWGPNPNPQLGSLSPDSFNQEPSNASPGHNFPTPASSEPDNTLEGTNWDAPPQNEPDYFYGMNNPSNFIPSDDLKVPTSPEMPGSGMDSGNNQQPPFPSETEGSTDEPCESTPSGQPILQDVVTEPSFNQEYTPEYSYNFPDNNNPASPNFGYNQDYPFPNQSPSGANGPTGYANAEPEQPMTLPGLPEPPALESANQVSEPCPDDEEQAGSPEFSGQYPEENGSVPGSVTFVPDYITPSYDDVAGSYYPEMEYQGSDDYGPIPNAAPSEVFQKPIQIPPGYQYQYPQGKPKYYNPANQNQGWSSESGPTSAGVDPSAIYIPVDPDQSVMLSDPNHDHDSDESCSCDDCYYDEIIDHKAFCKTACRDLEEARDELKAIFDKIKKKLKCTQRNKCFGNL